MFSDFFNNSFFQNYLFLSFTFFLSFISFIILTLFCCQISFCFRLRFICFVLVCIFVNHFSVRKDAVDFIFDNHIHRSSRDVNHLSVENPAIHRASRDVNHLSVENLFILDNITYNGVVQSTNTRRNQLEPIYFICQLYKNFVLGENWRIFIRFYPLIFCAITSLLKVFGSGGVRLLNYRVIDTPRRVLIKRIQWSPNFSSD